MVWRGVGMRLAEDTPDPVVTALAPPEAGLAIPADDTSVCNGEIIAIIYKIMLF